MNILYGTAIAFLIREYRMKSYADEGKNWCFEFGENKIKVSKDNGGYEYVLKKACEYYDIPYEELQPRASEWLNSPAGRYILEARNARPIRRRGPRP